MATRLFIIESARAERDQLEYLVEELGLGGAERRIGRDMDEIVDRVAMAWACYHDLDWRGVRRAITPVPELARRIGLSGIGRVAADVLETTRARDKPSSAATLERLTRLVESGTDAIGRCWLQSS